MTGWLSKFTPVLALGMLALTAGWGLAEEGPSGEAKAGGKVPPPEELEIAAPDLLFTDDELARLEMARRGETETASRKAEAEADAVEAASRMRLSSSALHLSSIVYTGPESWAIWLNGRRITPNRLPDNMESISVNKNVVAFNLRSSRNKPTVRVLLRPNQSYLISSGEIIEGLPQGG